MTLSISVCKFARLNDTLSIMLISSTISNWLWFCFCWFCFWFWFCWFDDCWLCDNFDFIDWLYMIFFVEMSNVSMITLMLKIDRKTNSKMMKLFDWVIDETLNVNTNAKKNRIVVDWLRMTSVSSMSSRNRIINRETKKSIVCCLFDVIDFFDVISIDDELTTNFLMISNAIL